MPARNVDAGGLCVTAVRRAQVGILLPSANRHIDGSATRIRSSIPWFLGVPNGSSIVRQVIAWASVPATFAHSGMEAIPLLGLRSITCHLVANC